MLLPKAREGWMSSTLLLVTLNLLPPLVLTV